VGVLPESVTPAELQAMCDLFFQASDSTRLAILLHLSLGSRCVCDLADEVGMSVSAVSHQLKNLRVAGLVSRRRDGRHIHYELADDHVRQLLTLGLEHIRE